MWIDEDLPPEVAKAIQPICREAEQLLTRDQHVAAIAKHCEAFSLLPEPKDQWLAGTWILAAIGDIAYLSGDLPLAAQSYRDIGFFPGWEDNAFIRLRRGQIAFDEGSFDVASNELACAFMLGGYEIMEHEEEKYAEFVLSKMLPPIPPVSHPLARFHLQEQRPWWKFW